MVVTSKLSLNMTVTTFTVEMRCIFIQSHCLRDISLVQMHVLNAVLSFTLKQTFLEFTFSQPSAQVVEGTVGGAGVKTAPSAMCLQIYFSLLVQGSTSQRPAKLPVAIATQPCRWPYFVIDKTVSHHLWSHFQTDLTERRFSLPGISAFQ